MLWHLHVHRYLKEAEAMHVNSQENHMQRPYWMRAGLMQDCSRWHAAMTEQAASLSLSCLTRSPRYQLHRCYIMLRLDWLGE